MSLRLYFCLVPASAIGMIAACAANMFDIPHIGTGAIAFGVTFLFGWGVTAPRTGPGECFADLHLDQPETERGDNGNPPCPVCDHWMAEDLKIENQFYCTNHCPLARVTLSLEAIIQLLKKQPPFTGN